MVPLVAVEASLFSSLFGNPVSANDDAIFDTSENDNSQTMALLEADSSVFSIGAGSEKNSTGVDNTNITGNALVPATSPLGVSDGTEVDSYSADQVSVYVVRKGDTISQIADMFDVSINTILAANDLKKGQVLTVGDVLLILPISGIEHTVTKGQTLAGIAKLYKADADDIATYNGIAVGEALAVGDKLIIPGGDDMADEDAKPATNLSTALIKDQNYYATHPIKDVSGYFINPVPTGRKTQGLHGPGHRGIDIGAPTGSPIYASAPGMVLIVKTGCTVGKKACGGGYGNMAIIQHANGTKTLYAHMSKVVTKIGASVGRGDVIGYVGNTGRSTGPHLHFEVFNAKNPGADWSWKQ